jgi:hypothetical protein
MGSPTSYSATKVAPSLICGVLDFHGLPPLFPAANFRRSRNIYLLPGDHVLFLLRSAGPTTDLPI